MKDTHQAKRAYEQYAPITPENKVIQRLRPGEYFAINLIQFKQKRNPVRRPDSVQPVDEIIHRTGPRHQHRLPFFPCTVLRTDQVRQIFDEKDFRTPVRKNKAYIFNVLPGIISRGHTFQKRYHECKDITRLCQSTAQDQFLQI